MAKVIIPMTTSFETKNRPTTPPDPWQVYISTRPTDWLKMPAAHAEVALFAQSSVASQEIQNNEIYLLFHIPVNTQGMIAFTATSTGQYSVQIGTMVSGTFVENPIFSVLLNSGSTYENILNPSDFSNITADGFAQCMIRISASSILTWELSPHSKKGPLPTTYSCWNIVEFAGKLPDATKATHATSVTTRAPRMLKYYNLYSTSKITNGAFMFNACSSLTCTPVLALSSNLYATNSMFTGCTSLLVAPNIDTSNVTNMSYMYSTCTSLSVASAMNTSSATNMDFLFNGNVAMTLVPALNTANVTTMRYLFNNCSSLSEIPALNLLKLNIALTSAFNAVYACTSIVFVPGTWTTPQDLSVVDMTLSHIALVTLFQSLPTISISKALTITGNPGVVDLTADDKAIATSRGWTLIL